MRNGSSDWSKITRAKLIVPGSIDWRACCGNCSVTDNLTGCHGGCLCQAKWRRGAGVGGRGNSIYE